MCSDKNWRTENGFVDEERACREIVNRVTGAGVDRGIALGTCGWSYKDWLGPFYPAGTRQQDYLRAYAQVFRTVEIDSTFYAVPRRSVVESWRERTPADFIFTARFPRAITHEQNGLDPANPVIGHFLDTISLLGDKLGVLLIHLSPSLPPEEIGRLRRVLTTLPREFRYAVEFRHKGWLNEKTLDLLAELNMAWVIGAGLEEAPDRPLTTDFTYIRWLGDRSITDFGEVVVDREADIAAWANWIESRRDRLNAVHGYVNNHFNGHSPAAVRALLTRLRQPVPEPPRPEAPDQGELFA